MLLMYIFLQTAAWLRAEAYGEALPYMRSIKISVLVSSSIFIILTSKLYTRHRHVNSLKRKYAEQVRSFNLQKFSNYPFHM